MTYIVLEDLNYKWSKSEIDKILDCWHEGMSLQHISSYMQRDYDECGLLLIDIAGAASTLIPKRSNGINESEQVEKCYKYSYKVKKLLHENPDEYEMFSKRRVDYFWDLKEVDRFVRYWKENMSFSKMIKYFNRTSLEIQLLIVDQCRANRIQPRKIGLGVELI